MANHVYKIVDIAGSSPDSTDAAIKNAISKVGETVDNLDWFEVTETRGVIEDGKISHYQVVLKIGFRVD